MTIPAAQLAKLIEQHAVALQLWIGPRCDSVEDVVQEAFCRLAVLQSPPEYPVSWLYRVVRNLAETRRISEQRRQVREKKAALPERVEADPAQQMQTDEAVRAVLELNDSLREVVTARIWGGLNFEEIASLCEISTATASRRYREALLQLRTQLETPCPTPIR